VWLNQLLNIYIYRERERVVSYVKQYPRQNFANKEVPFSLSHFLLLWTVKESFSGIWLLLSSTVRRLKSLLAGRFLSHVGKQGKPVFCGVAKEHEKANKPYALQNIILQKEIV
jgi:hypothetical protein